MLSFLEEVAEEPLLVEAGLSLNKSTSSFRSRNLVNWLTFSCELIRTKLFFRGIVPKLGVLRLLIEPWWLLMSWISIVEVSRKLLLILYLASMWQDWIFFSEEQWAQKFRSGAPLITSAVFLEYLSGKYLSDAPYRYGAAPRNSIYFDTELIWTLRAKCLSSASVFMSMFQWKF